MYAHFFGLSQEPFSIAPDPRYLFMSERHREALAHLLYGLRGGGGFVLLTGEIGAGKTTVCRCFLEQIPANCDVAYVFNPRLTVGELLQTVCEEFHIALPPADALAGGMLKPYVDAINAFLLASHAAGRHSVLIIDEAQNLSAEVLEQLRLLTNLETPERKLLQIILIGQPELRGMLARPELEQLAQRVIARFHLEALSEHETTQYIEHRLAVAGHSGQLPFDGPACRRIHQLARGVPRRINLLCDRALLGAYATGRSRVDRRIVEQAAAEVFDHRPQPVRRYGLWAGGAGLVVLAAAAYALSLHRQVPPTTPAARPAAAASAPRAPASQAASALPGMAEAGWAQEAEALRALAGLWQVKLSGLEEPCTLLRQQQLPCLRSGEGLAQLRLLGRPAVLPLREGEAAPTYALLLGLDAQHALLRRGGLTQTLSLLDLSRQWRGDFVTLWRAPPGYLDRAEDDALAEWLDPQLTRVLGEPAPSTGRPEAQRAARVSAFQRSQGLRADGRAGPITLMQLNRLVGIDEPRLQALPPSTAKN
ncbi:MAG: peptidoglycan-binding protein [Roseateles depolymerans]|uniref:Peptidoglycan-binding protein n=1 Tax=Roseateles depolymerans TaxID=76731 RepID=A0A2W5DXC8_9BURK|nr:MAG: peptidoglycan-binding protein [Roseateles depolymerans]